MGSGIRGSPSRPTFSQYFSAIWLLHFILVLFYSVTAIGKKIAVRAKGALHNAPHKQSKVNIYLYRI